MGINGVGLYNTQGCEVPNRDRSAGHSSSFSDFYEKLKSKVTETSYQIGGNSFTEKEWEKLLDEVDDITEEMREAMRKKHQKRFEEAVAEKNVKYREYR